MADTDFTQRGTFSLSSMEIKLVSLFRQSDEDAQFWLLAKALILSEAFPSLESIEDKSIIDNDFLSQKSSDDMIH